MQALFKVKRKEELKNFFVSSESKRPAVALIAARLICLTIGGSGDFGRRVVLLNGRLLINTKGRNKERRESDFFPLFLGYTVLHGLA